MIECIIWLGSDNINISLIIVPLIVLFIIIFALIKKIDIFDSFIEGAIDGLKTTLKIFPTILGIVLSVNIIYTSGFFDVIINIFKPLCNIFNMPSEVLPIALLRPVSASSSLVIFNNILTNYGPDSLIGKLASIIQGSNDTTIYILSLYYGSIGIKKIGHSLKLGILCDIITVILSVIVVKILY